MTNLYKVTMKNSDGVSRDINAEGNDVHVAELRAEYLMSRRGCRGWIVCQAKFIRKVEKNEVAGFHRISAITFVEQTSKVKKVSKKAASSMIAAVRMRRENILERIKFNREWNDFC